MKTQSNANFVRPWSSGEAVVIFLQTKFDRPQGGVGAQEGERMAGGAGVRMNDSTHA